MDGKVAPCLAKYLEMCINIDECRGPRGVRYPTGLLVFSILLAMCAGNEGQRSQARWFVRHWHWIKKLWLQAGGSISKSDGIPSQSTISRFEGTISAEEIYRQFDEIERNLFRIKLGDNLNEIELKHLCVDGKARCGCESDEMGRTEVDVTIFSPSTAQVISSFALEDKQGELKGLESMIDEVGDELRGTIITCDAGITSILKTNILEQKEIDAIVQIKGNAGESFSEISDLPWEKVKDEAIEYSHGHGRDEVRISRKIDLNFYETDLSDKYPSVACVVQIESWSKKTSTGKVTNSMRYYLGTSLAAELEAQRVGSIIRNHWGIESFHWSKDTTLGEDRSQVTRSNASRFIGRLRSAIVQIGKASYGSVTHFLEDFRSAPYEVAFT